MLTANLKSVTVADMVLSIAGSTVALPVTGGLCRTNAAGRCITAIGETVDFHLANRAIATFSAFVTASGSIPFSPAINRGYVHFYQGTTPVGSASVAIRTVSPDQLSAMAD